MARRSKKIGNAFESLFFNSCSRMGVTCIRIPDGCKQYGTDRNGRPLLHRVETPFDYMVTIPGRSAVVDCKTTKGKRFTFSMLTHHQVESLYAIGQAIPAGYVVYFQVTNLVVFFDSFTLARLKARESLGPENGLTLGEIGSFRLDKVFTFTNKQADIIFELEE